MTAQAINLELPEDIYRRLTDVAALTRQPLEEIIFQSLRGNLPPVLTDLDPPRRALVAELPGLSDVALWAVAREPLPASRWRQHQRLLRKGGQGTGTATVGRDHAATSCGGALGGRPRRLGQGGATQGVGGTW